VVREAAQNGVKTIVIEKKGDIGIPVRCAEILVARKRVERPTDISIYQRNIVQNGRALAFYSPNSGQYIELETYGFSQFACLLE